MRAGLVFRASGALCSKFTPVAEKTDSNKIARWKKTENPKCTVMKKTTFAKSAVAENTKMPGAKTLAYQGF